MSGRSLHINLEINYPLILGVSLLIHLLVFLFLHAPGEIFVVKTEESPHPLKIHQIRKVGARESKSLNETYLNRSLTPSKSLTRSGPKEISQSPRTLRDLSMNDLSAVPMMPKPQVAQAPKRPGTRPEVSIGRKKAIEAVSLRGNAQMKKFIQGQSAVALSGDERDPGMNNTDVMVNLEVPEGVSPDELNEYELMFYGFQRRTAMNYINSFYNNLDEFQRRNPHKQFPMTDTKQVMTGRLTYDSKGNIKQIKMIRWSNVDALQDFFVDVLKDMDTLHNPPTALWEKDGEFSIFFTLSING